jgi:hypothetical protein
MLNFSDGVSINTSGKPRIVRLKDGLYVVGGGWSIPVDDEEEAREILGELTSREETPRS